MMATLREESIVHSSVFSRKTVPLAFPRKKQSCFELKVKQVYCDWSGLFHFTNLRKISLSFRESIQEIKPREIRVFKDNALDRMRSLAKIYRNTQRRTKEGQSDDFSG